MFGGRATEDWQLRRSKIGPETEREKRDSLSTLSLRRIRGHLHGDRGAIHLTLDLMQPALVARPERVSLCFLFDHVLGAAHQVGERPGAAIWEWALPRREGWWLPIVSSLNPDGAGTFRAANGVAVMAVWGAYAGIVSNEGWL
jgi:hypothetical protein